jgi:HSP20 family protein
MANTERTQSQQSQSSQPATQTQTQSRGGDTDIQRSEQSRRQSAGLVRNDPFSMLVDRLFEGFGFGRPFASTGQVERQQQMRAQAGDWIPRIEVSHQGNELVVRADLPGMERGDIEVEVDDDMLVIRGDRRQEHREQDEQGWTRTEVSYGSFVRTVPLPEGTIPDSANASFKNGVLDIRLQAPPHAVNRGRKIEVK